MVESRFPSAKTRKPVDTSCKKRSNDSHAYFGANYYQINIMKSLIIKSILASAVALAIVAPQNARSAGIILDDFNVNEGHFANTIGFSGTTVGENGTLSTADRVTTNAPVEGAGHQKLVLVHDASTTAFRLRHVSGGAAPSANTPFATTAGTDGKIGFYLKTTATGWQTSINIDGQGNSIAEMAGSTSVPVISDGQWHLYEWDLDSTTDWGAVPGIGGGFGGALPDRVTNTIDSIYLRDLDGSPGPDAEIYFDFLAINPSGSVSNLLLDPCLATSGVLVGGPISTNTNSVTVTGVDPASTAVTVYQDSGSGFVSIGSTNVIVGGNNSVTVSGLVKGARVVATQTKAGQESCVSGNGALYVGGGANPSVRLAYSIRETSNTGPVGTSATDLGSGNIHFLGASTVSGGAPIDAAIITPSNGWQTVTIGGKVRIANSANAVGAVAAGTTYNPGSTVAIQVYPFKTVNATRIYSVTNGVAQSSTVTSNEGPFSVNWTWDAVPGAEGYRILRDVGGFGFLENIDVVTNSLVDTNNGAWGFSIETTPTSYSLSPSIQWNPSVGNTNGPATAWGILESLNFAIDSDTGPFDIYIDNIQNGSTVFQTFETVASGTQDYGFRAPSFSGTTGGNLLAVPNLGIVTNLTADTGTNSINVQFQWSGTNSQRWLRLTTSQAGTAANPLLNLDDPTSIRILLLPVGTVITPPVQSPTIGHSLSGNQLTLTWTGTFNLQSKTNLSDSTWTNEGVSNSPYVTNVVGAAKFYRLQSP
jgi:hypothetical protein